MTIDNEACWEQYRIERIENNYQRYRRVNILLGVLGVLFLARNLYFYGDRFTPLSYPAVYGSVILLSLLAAVFLPLSHRRRRYGLIDILIHIYSVLIFQILIHLSLLDSFIIEWVDFTAYIFSALMLGFILRTGRRFSLCLYLGSILYYTVGYRILRPELFSPPALLPLGPITFCAFYFSWSRESMNRRNFRLRFELAESNRRLTDQTHRDALTGLHNRRFLEEFLSHQTALFRRQGTPCTVIFGDIDHFKRVNDELGHAVGDRVLIEFAGILTRCSREVDLVVRYGGEEFLIVLPGSCGEEGLEMAERIRARTGSFAFGGVPHPLTASFGIAEISKDDSIDSLVDRADQRLYTAKRAGRNRCCFKEKL